MIKMVCSDLDGTLLQYGKKLIEGEIFDEIRALNDRGILFCPASGRQYTSLRKLFAPVADDCIYLCENGAVVYRGGKVIAKTPMPRALAEEIAWDFWNNTEDLGEVMLSGENMSYLMERGHGVVDRIKFIGNNYTVITDPAQIPEDIVKVSVYLVDGVEPFVERFVPKWQQANCAVAESLSTKRTTPRLLKFSPKVMPPIRKIWRWPTSWAFAIASWATSRKVWLFSTKSLLRTTPNMRRMS